MKSSLVFLAFLLVTNHAGSWLMTTEAYHSLSFVVQVHPNSNLQCVGTLISKNVVLTAKLCAESTDIKVTLPNGKSVQANRVIHDQEFSIIALVELKEGIADFDDFASLYLSMCEVVQLECYTLFWDKMSDPLLTVNSQLFECPSKSGSKELAYICTQSDHCSPMLGSPLMCPVNGGYTQYGVLVESNTCRNQKSNFTFATINYFSMWILNELNV